MDNKIQEVRVQTQSMGKYIQDIWLIALLLVIFQHDTSFTLPYLWIILQIIIAISMQLIIRKTGPNPIIPFIVPTSVLLILFLFNSPLWLFIVGAGISIWRLQVRFNKIQDEQNVESNYLINFLFVFLTVLVIGFMLQLDDFTFTLYNVVITGIVLFVGMRLYAVWKSTNKNNSASMSYVVGGFSLGLLGITGLSTILYMALPFIRKVLGLLIGKVISIAIIPFIPLLEYLDKLLDKLDLKFPEEIESDPLEEEEEMDPTEMISESNGVDFPFEIILYILAAMIIIFFVRFLLRNKTDILTADSSVIQYVNKDLEDDKEDKKLDAQLSLYKVDTSLLREKYKEFELEASLYTYKRTKSETVRDWFGRMEWMVQEEFFQVYEEVRYGGRTISSKKAEVFESNLEKIKNTFFFEKDV